MFDTVNVDDNGGKGDGCDDGDDNRVYSGDDIDDDIGDDAGCNHVYDDVL